MNGNRERRSGILHNELYIGVLVYNRMTFTKDPDTGKRQSRMNPSNQWQTVQVPALRIISDELWQAVQGSQGSVPAHAYRTMQTTETPFSAA